MKACAFLTMDNLDDFESYDHLLVEPFADLGWKTDFVSWRKENVDWNAYDAVIIRSPWDYQHDPEAFMTVLEKIDQSSAQLENSLELVRQNINKTYLRDLQNRGIDIVPTLWRESYSSDMYHTFFDELQTHEVVIKPVVSAGADNTFRLNGQTDTCIIDKLHTIFDDRPFMVQPFMPNIVEEGEFSLFFFGDTYSHTILKTPKKEDFRVQEEHGGQLRKVNPEPQLLNHAHEILRTITPPPLYTRIDSVRTEDDAFALMELELIEPSLYFNMDPESPQLFARIFDRWMKRQP